MRDFSWGGYVSVLRVDWAESSLLYLGLSPPRPGEAFSSLGHLSLCARVDLSWESRGNSVYTMKGIDSWNFSGTKDHRRNGENWKYNNAGENAGFFFFIVVP